MKMITINDLDLDNFIITEIWKKLPKFKSNIKFVIFIV